jgi:hypothetical protein
MKSEIARVLLIVQGTLLLVAGLGALPFGIVEHGIRIEGLATILVAAVIFAVARDFERLGTTARWSAFGLELFLFIGSLLLAVLPLGAIRGPVPLVSNLLMPLAIALLLREAGLPTTPRAH